MATLKYWLWLTGRDSLPLSKRQMLLDRFGTPENIYFADPGE